MKREAQKYFSELQNGNDLSTNQTSFDQKERVIAQRLNSNGRLITTRENKYFKIRNHRSERALEVYALITAIEEKEYEEMIQNYWYQERKRA